MSHIRSSQRHRLISFLVLGSILLAMTIHANALLTEDNNLACSHTQCPVECPEDSYLQASFIPLYDATQDEDFPDDYLDEENFDSADEVTQDPFAGTIQLEELATFEQLPPVLEDRYEHKPQTSTEFSQLKERQKRELKKEQEIDKCCGQQKCLCAKCPEFPKCSEGNVAISIKEGQGTPGSCCSLYQCVPKVACSSGGQQTFWKTKCLKCSCFGDFELCENQCPHEETLLNCYSEYLQKYMLNDAHWHEGGCLKCHCDQGQRRCFGPLCRAPDCSGGKLVKLENECCPKCVEEKNFMENTTTSTVNLLEISSTKAIYLSLDNSTEYTKDFTSSTESINFQFHTSTVNNLNSSLDSINTNNNFQSVYNSSTTLDDITENSFTTLKSLTAKANESSTTLAYSMESKNNSTSLESSASLENNSLAVLETSDNIKAFTTIKPFIRMDLNSSSVLELSESFVNNSERNIEALEFLQNNASTKLELAESTLINTSLSLPSSVNESTMSPQEIISSTLTNDAENKSTTSPASTSVYLSLADSSLINQEIGAKNSSNKSTLINISPSSSSSATESTISPNAIFSSTLTNDVENASTSSSLSTSASLGLEDSALTNDEIEATTVYSDNSNSLKVKYSTTLKPVEDESLTITQITLSNNDLPADHINLSSLVGSASSTIASSSTTAEESLTDSSSTTSTNDYAANAIAIEFSTAASSVEVTITSSTKTASIDSSNASSTNNADLSENTVYSSSTTAEPSLDIVVHSATSKPSVAASDSLLIALVQSSTAKILTAEATTNAFKTATVSAIKDSEVPLEASTVKQQLNTESSTSSPYTSTVSTTTNDEDNLQTTTYYSSTSAPMAKYEKLNNPGNQTQLRYLFNQVDYVVMIVLFIGAILCITLGLIIRHTKNRKKMYSSIPNSESSLSQNSTNTAMTV